MIFIRSLLLAFLMVGAVAQMGHAQTACAISAQVRSDVGGPPVVVDAPADGATDLGAMPMVYDPARGMMGATATITAVKNGYVAVTQIAPWQGETIALEGWVAARDLAFVAQTQQGFAAPDATSAVMWSATDGISPDMIDTIVDCHGDWVAVEMADKSVTAPVWVRGACGGQDAPCDAPQAD